MDVYPNYANFKQRVLNPSQKELNQKTDISFEFEEVKLGRKVQKIRFIIHSQKRKGTDSAHFEKNSDDFKQPNTFEEKIKRFEERCKGKVHPAVLEKWKKHEELVLEIIDDISFRVDIDSPIGYVEYMLSSRLKEQSDNEILIQNNQENLFNNTLEINKIINAIITKYSASTGAVATFLVKDTAINELVKICTLVEAEECWNKNEEFVMNKIYERIKRNRRIRR
ncbi:hypothetical protein CN681_09590 [Bacillus toyonensis]|nr:hypothetical protein CN681_09590 [Bacillus toyonensis]PGB89827.1 hypothetical protein COM19_31170 [Bacillus toyonensis]